MHNVCVAKIYVTTWLKMIEIKPILENRWNRTPVPSRQYYSFNDLHDFTVLNQSSNNSRLLVPLSDIEELRKK